MCCYFMHLVCLWKPIMLKRKKKERETSNGVPKKILVTEKDEKCIWFHRTSFLFLRYLNICPKVFWFCKKKFDKERKVNFKIYDDVNWEINNYKTQIKLPKMGNKVLSKSTMDFFAKIVAAKILFSQMFHCRYFLGS